MTLSAGDRLGPYEIVAPLGEGGMGEVYRARDTRLKRDVAVKVLPEGAAADPELRRRFEQEALAVAALSHPNIVALYDIGTHDGAPFLVSELLEGMTLADALHAGARPAGEAVEVAIQMAKGLAAAHARSIIHRDLKPSNVFVTTAGHVKILDFGIAKLTRPDPDAQTADLTTQAPSTERGAVIGTAGYMSPEQVRGLPTDPRTDIFSFGCVLYEMLAGQRAFKGATRADTLSAILKEDPQPLRDLREAVPPALQQVVERCLEKRPEDRFSSAPELALALEAVSAGTPQAERDTGLPSTIATSIRARRWTTRPWVAAAIGLVLVVAAALTFLAVRRSSQVRWTRNVALPEIARLVERDDSLAAYALAEKAEQHLKGDATLEALFARTSQHVSIKTTPAGAAVYFTPYSNPTVAEQYLGQSPIENIRLPLKPYWLRVEKDGFDTVRSFYPGVGPYGTPETLQKLDFPLRKTGDIPPGMVPVPQDTYVLDLYGLPKTVEALPAFLIDDHEVTNREFEQFVASGGYEKPDYWEHEFVRDGRVLAFYDAMAAFVDRTGRPGPSTWEAGRFPDGQDDYPVSGVSWYEAAAFARFAGKSLPTIYHWNASSWTAMAALIVPFSNFGSEGPRRVRAGPVEPGGTWDMAGNVKEWCWNASGNRRFVLGGGWNDPTYMYYEADARPPFERTSTLGFRCARYLPAGSDPKPETLRPVRISDPGRRQFVPISTEAYTAYVRQYAYDPAPLNAKVESVDGSSPLWSRERISFDAAYNHERVIAYLFVPKSASPPFQTVVYFPGASAVIESGTDALQMRIIDFIVKSGRAVMYPVYKGTYERQTGLTMVDATPTRAYTEHVVQWIQDLRRSVDYLATRRDVDLTKLAYYGFSWGGSIGSIALALEPRLRLGVFLDGGIWPGEAFPEASDTTFAPRVSVPVLMLNGSGDSFFPLETSQKPLYKLLGTPEQHKKTLRYDSYHGVLALHRNEVVKEILNWLDQYFGKPRRIAQ
jgi:formylglycine-generating enzyme required for sulfatase activity/dienelactone hydrolase